MSETQRTLELGELLYGCIKARRRLEGLGLRSHVIYFLLSLLLYVMKVVLCSMRSRSGYQARIGVVPLSPWI